MPEPDHDPVIAGSGSGEIRSLNSLRGIAAMIVVVSHFSGVTGWLGEFPASGAGQLGVMLFFILSGFLMAYLYLGQPFTAPSLRRYIVARIARVVPLFAVVVALSAVLPRIGITGVLYDLPTRAQVLSHVLLLSGKNILWTIPTEMHFYAVFVVLWAVFQKTSVGLPAIVLLAATGLVATGRFAGTLGEIPYEFRLPQVIPYFAVGGLLGVIYRKWPQLRRRQHPAFASVLLVVVLLYPRVFEELTGERHQLWRDPRVFVVMSIVFAVVLFGVPKESPVLANKLGDFVGRISYSLYLLHVPVMWAVRKLSLPNPIRFVVFLAVATLVATVSYHLLERPAARAVRRLGEQRSELESLRLPSR